MIDILSVIAMGLALFGQYLVAKKNIWTFPIWILSNILWMIVNIIDIHNYSQMFMYIVFTIMQIRAWYLWKNS